MCNAYRVNSTTIFQVIRHIDGDAMLACGYLLYGVCCFLLVVCCMVDVKCVCIPIRACYSIAVCGSIAYVLLYSFDTYWYGIVYGAACACVLLVTRFALQLLYAVRHNSSLRVVQQSYIPFGTGDIRLIFALSASSGMFVFVGLCAMCCIGMLFACACIVKAHIKKQDMRTVFPFAPCISVWLPCVLLAMHVFP